MVCVSLGFHHVYYWFVFSGFATQPIDTDLQALVKRLSNEEEVNVKEGKECDNFLNAFDVFVLMMKFAQSNCNQIDNKFKMKLVRPKIAKLLNIYY